MRTEINVGSAISLLNAIRTGIGIAMGIHAEISITINPSDTYQIVNNRDDVDGSLIESCNHSFTEKFGISVINISVSLRSELPPQRGLKTSSAISSGYLTALCRHFNVQFSSKDILAMSADASKRIGVSLTGAIDDSLSTLLGGLVVTDNRNQKVLHHVDHDISYHVLLLIPPLITPKHQIDQSPVDNEEVTSIVDSLIYKGLDITLLRRLLVINKEIYEDLIPDEITLLNEILDKNEVISLNGGGPSLFILHRRTSPQSLIDRVKTIVPTWTIKSTKFRTKGAISLA